MKTLKNYLFLIIIILFFFFIFTNMKMIMNLTQVTKNQISDQLFISLFPFMLIITICQKLGIISLFAYFLQFVSIPLFKISGHCFSIYLFSLLSGYPTNAKMIQNAYLENHINLNEVNFLIKTAHHSSFSFILLVVCQSFSNQMILVTFVCHIFPTLIYLIVSHKQKPIIISFNQCVQLYTKNVKINNLFIIIQTSIKECILTFIYIFGFVFISKTILAYINTFFNPYISFYLLGYLEISSGVLLISQNSINQILKQCLLVSYISFGSLSVFMQINQILTSIPFSFKSYFTFRCYHSFLSSFMMFIYLIH